MKIYSAKEYKLRMMNPGVKMITAIFLVMVLGGYVTGFAMGLMKAGFGAEALADYYCGNELQGIYPKSALELMEVTHFHLLSMPIVFLIVGHLMMMTYFHLRTRVIVVALSFLGMVLDLLGPWLVRFVSPAFVYLKLFGSGIFGITFLLMIFAEVYEIYFRRDPYELTDLV